MKKQILSFLENSAFLREYVVKRLSDERSSEWTAVRNAFIKIHNKCAMCEGKNQLQVHHKQPFSRNPDLELDPDNLITLCARDHLIFGHLGSWKSFNINVEEDCNAWNGKLRNRPKAL